MSVGDIKGFFTDIGKDLLIVGVFIYLGGATLGFRHADLEKYPIDINKFPYVDDCDKKTDLFSLELFTQFGFPYSMINDIKDNPVNDVKVWLAMTCATFFIFIRKMFRSLIKHVVHFYPSFFGNMFFYYVFPFVFLYLLRTQRMLLTGFFYFMVFLCAVWLENYTIIFSPLTFPWWVYRGSEASFMKIILAILFFFVGFFFIPVYLIWWYLLANIGFLYVVIFYLFSPFFNGFNSLLQEAGKHKMSLSILFMTLALFSAQTYLTSFLVKAGMFTACICVLCYWFYSEYYSKK
jgi:hypothetical protein